MTAVCVFFSLLVHWAGIFGALGEYFEFQGQCVKVDQLLMPPLCLHLLRTLCYLYPRPVACFGDVQIQTSLRDGTLTYTPAEVPRHGLPGGYVQGQRVALPLRHAGAVCGGV